MKKWQHGHTGGWQCRYVELGELPDGRWYVRLIAQVYVPARIFADEQTARAVADELMAGESGWREVPALFNSRHWPVEPGWRRVGGGWERKR